jgi:hypothetical protein
MLNQLKATHTHTNYIGSYKRKRGHYYDGYVDSELTLDNSVGLELTQRASQQTRTLSTDLPVAGAPPEVDHHQEPTNVVHMPTSSTRVVKRGLGHEASLAKGWQTKSQRHPKIPHLCCTTNGEPQAMSSKAVSQEKHDTRTPPPPDPRI